MTEDEIYDLCDFIDEPEEVVAKPDQEEKLKSLYKKDGKEIIYDNHTMVYYSTLRKRKLDPITNDSLTDETAFIFPYQWDPYTGERLGIDPYGALYFHPDSLIRYFYLNRLNNLWIEPQTIDGILFSGHYGDALGTGKTFKIPSRGENPEQYIFRLPIQDCYLTEDHDISLITMGPALTNEEVQILYEKAQTYFSDNYTSLFKKPRPNIVQIKKFYDDALKEDGSYEDNVIAVEYLKQF